MTLVGSVQVGAGGAASIEWTGIPATGTDLVVVFSLRCGFASTGVDGNMALNNDTGANYTGKRLQGSGTAAASSDLTASATSWRITTDGSTATAATFGNGQVYIPNYTGSTAKSASIDAVTENNAAAANQHLLACLWSGTAAVNRVTIFAGGGSTFDQYSTASLYTIQKGSGGASVA